tara:strand:+ start:486 stop:1400 length:915 start_codon:yes stop_codon:yes gene_type:complete
VVRTPEPIAGVVNANELVDRLSDNTLRLCDCRFSLVNEHAGRESYQANHIPGATYVDLGRDLAGPITTASGRHPLPAAARWLQTLGKLGITRYSQVVAYDEGSGAMAARLWWMLKWSGVNSVALLNGGMAEWERRALPTERGNNRYPAADFVGKVCSGMQAEAKVILENIDRRKLLVIDAREPPRFRGDTEPLDIKAGHIPHAVNRPFLENLSRGLFKPKATLAEEFGKLLGGLDATRVIHSCGSGVTACHNLFAMDYCGLAGSRLYPGSWSEWITDSKRPVATGDGVVAKSARGVKTKAASGR